MRRRLISVAIAQALAAASWPIAATDPFSFQLMATKRDYRKLRQSDQPVSTRLAQTWARMAARTTAPQPKLPPLDTVKLRTGRREVKGAAARYQAKTSNAV